MIDFTKVQTYKVLPEFETLNETNLTLVRENKYLKNILLALVVGEIIYLVYQTFTWDNEVEQL